MAQQLHGRGILGKAQRVVHRGEDDAGPDLDPGRCLSDRRARDEERGHVPVVDEMVLGGPHRAEAEPLGLDGDPDGLVVGARPVRLARPKLGAEESEAESHTTDDSARVTFASARADADPDREQQNARPHAACRASLCVVGPVVPGRSRLPDQRGAILMRPKLAPCGSDTIENLPPGKSIGAFSSLAPSSSALRCAASTSSTSK